MSSPSSLTSNGFLKPKATMLFAIWRILLGGMRPRVTRIRLDLADRYQLYAHAIFLDAETRRAIEVSHYLADVVDRAPGGLRHQRPECSRLPRRSGPLHPVARLCPCGPQTELDSRQLGGPGYGRYKRGFLYSLFRKDSGSMPDCADNFSIAAGRASFSSFSSRAICRSTSARCAACPNTCFVCSRPV